MVKNNDFSSEKIKLNIYHKDGSVYEGKDITEKPFGDNETVVSFWEDNKVVVFPLVDIIRYELYCE